MNTLQKQQPQYIGDGIYIQINKEDPAQLILTTSSHLLEDADNIVYIEMGEARSLMNYFVDFLGEQRS